MPVSIILNSDVVEVFRGVETVDEYNSKVVDWSNPAVVAVGKGSIQHFVASEDDRDRQTTTEGLRLISDDPVFFNDAILPTDRIRYAGRLYEVDGAIQEWRLFGKPHHIEVYIKRVVG